MLTLPTRRHNDDDGYSEPPSVRVLLVDDDPNFRAWMALLMRRLGFGVETAENGEDAVELLQSGSFDLLIADYQMPRMNGMDLIRVVRDTPSLAHQYAVMLTSQDDLESKIAALTIGYDDFLTKSCTEVEVIAKVVAAKRMLARTRMLSAAANEWQTIATRDELTGVATRRTLITEGERALSEGRPIGIALVDLDDFKPINDNFGHLTGDRILSDIGGLFLRRTRANDLIARFGGDEFVLLVTDLPVDDLAGAAERLTEEVEALQWTLGDITVNVRVTAGIAHSSLMEGATLEQLLDIADRDLYAKKWVKKHPGSAAADLYEYPGRTTAARVLPLPSKPEPRQQKRAADEEN